MPSDKTITTLLLAALILFSFPVSADTCRGGEPSAGQLWDMDPPRKIGDPFPHQDWGDPVKILDVKDGWVRYDMGMIFKDERQPITDFCRFYKRHQ